jgi:signal transduction histidine kinase
MKAFSAREQWQACFALSDVAGMLGFLPARAVAHEPDVTLRVKLLIVLLLAVVLSTGLVAWTVSARTSTRFEQLEAQRNGALVEQFRREFAARGEVVVRSVAGIADAEATLRMAIDLARPNPDLSLYVHDARGLARAHQLAFVEFVDSGGMVFSSSHWPTRFGAQSAWADPAVDWLAAGPFLKREEFPIENPDGSIHEGVTRGALVLAAVRRVGIGEKKIFVTGAMTLDDEFLNSLVLPEGMRALLYRNLEENFNPALLTSRAGAIPQPEKLAPLIEKVRRAPAEAAETVQWSADAASAESFHAMPLLGRARELLGVLLVGSSRRELVETQSFIQEMAVLAGGAGIVVALLFSLWVTRRVTRPVEQLASAAGQVATGDWGARVYVGSKDEIGTLAAAFNQMTRQLTEQRERLVQAERVAAWRELARRLAHELKNPLFPLQITIENLQRARLQTPAQFDEVFREGTHTLLAELDNLKTIVGRFSDFARMPPPQLASVQVNDIVRNSIKLLENQFSGAGRPQIEANLYLEEDLPEIQADRDLLHRAFQNLILNALDAMPSGGSLTVRTRPAAAGVRVEISDTGQGLTPEECARLFTPYYTTKQYGTGLGLAIVQSVISDHGGRISVESEEGAGTTFRIELPREPKATADEHR